MLSSTAFALLSFVGVLAVVARAFLRRGRLYAVFAAVMLGLHTASAALVYPLLPGALQIVAIYLQAATLLHFVLLADPRLRGVAYRALVSVPGSWFWAGSLLALPWATLAALGFDPPAAWLPWAVALTGLYRSLVPRVETVDLALDRGYADDLQRWPRGRAPEGDRPLRIVQITDPHLGPFMSEAQLSRICSRAVAQNPDLIVLTGDFLTMESNGSRGALARALAPLAEAEGKVFACLGNHDHEALDEVRRGLAAVGARLLVDEAVVVQTGAGPVQILGADFRWRDRRAHLAALCARHPRVAGALRLVLLHDPTAFPDLPVGEGDLVLSGHTHGGQVGLVSLGLDWTVVSGLMGMPDHGLWARGPDRMYVHRGTGHYGYPIRLGVPAEESLLRVFPPPIG
ncbi:MAG: metallophosphoesterase [Alphaproteobacteria bacterium]|nr:metallophosphoesterase [Alphaproteobacteria bacterium]